MCHDVIGSSQGNHKRISFFKYTSAVFFFLSRISKDYQSILVDFFYTPSAFCSGGHPFLHSLFFPLCLSGKTSFIINTDFFFFLYINILAPRG